MSTTKTMVAQQKQLLGVVRGMSVTMRLASIAAGGMQRAMDAFDEKAAVRTQQSVATVERAMKGLAEPVAQAAAGLRALTEAVQAARKGQASMKLTLPTVSIQMASAVSMPPSAAVMAAGGAAGTAPADKLKDQVKKEVIPAFVKIGELIGSSIPILKLEKKAGSDSKVSSNQEGKKADEDRLAGIVGQLQQYEASSKTAQDVLAQSVSALQAEVRQSLTTAADTTVNVDARLTQIVDAVKELLSPLTTMADLLAKAAGANGGSSRKDVTPTHSRTALPASPGVRALPWNPEMIVPEATKAIVTHPYANASILPSTVVQQRSIQSAEVGLLEQKSAALVSKAEEQVQAEKSAANAETRAAPAQKQAELPDLKSQVGEMVAAYKTFMVENEAVSKFVADNWSFFGGIYEGVNVAIKAYNALQLVSKTVTVISSAAMYAQSLMTMGLKAAWDGLNKTMKANVIILIVSLLIGLGAAIVALWKNNDAFALSLMKIWHFILNSWDQLVIVFWDIVRLLLIGFSFWAKTVGKIYDIVINKIIDGVNFVRNIISAITGEKLELFGSFKFENLAEDLLNKVEEQQQAAIIAAEERKAARKVKEETFLEERAAEKAAKELKAEEQAQAEQYPSVGSPSGDMVQVGGGRLDEVGRVNDSVDISSEDLKMMRELAEMKNIQNFVTLTPSVNVQTGDIRNGMDVSSMVQAITAVLQDEIASSAEGVYA